MCFHQLKQIRNYSLGMLVEVLSDFGCGFYQVMHNERAPLQSASENSKTVGPVGKKFSSVMSWGKISLSPVITVIMLRWPKFGSWRYNYNFLSWASVICVHNGIFNWCRHGLRLEITRKDQTICSSRPQKFSVTNHSLAACGYQK